MRIIAVDDEKTALEGLMNELALAAPEAEINGFRSGREALSYCKNEAKDGVDCAFVCAEADGMKGVELCRMLSDLFPKINLIFTAQSDAYAMEAISLRCSGYIKKPVTPEKVRDELLNLRYPVEEYKKKKLYAKAFGKFEAYVDGRPLRFRYQKTRELLAFLVDRRGDPASNLDIVTALWEEDDPGGSHISYLKNIRTDLQKTLEESGCRECIVRKRGEMAIDPAAIDCDYYDYLDNKDVKGSEILFKGEYMSQYAWGEYTLASLYSWD